MTSCSDTVLLYADLTNTQVYARGLASRMVTNSRINHDFAALTRWSRCYTELKAATAVEVEAP